jgi:hypothetical protein
MSTTLKGLARDEDLVQSRRRTRRPPTRRTHRRRSAAEASAVVFHVERLELSAPARVFLLAEESRRLSGA